MGVLDKLGKVAKGVGKGIIDTGKSIKKEIDDNLEIKRKKRTILSRFTMKDLKKICYEYGIGQPSSYDEDIITGEREKIKLTRDDYIDYIIRRLNLNQITDFCYKHRMPLPDFIQKEHYKTPSPTQQIKTKGEKPHIIDAEQEISTSNEFDTILNFISEFKPEPFVDEKDLQNQLKVKLESGYPNRIMREVGTQLGGKIDFAIDGKYGIEVKPIWDKKTLQDLIGQIILYKRAFNEVGVVLCDIGKLHHSVVKEFLKEYRNQGAKAIVIRGNIRSKRGKTREIRFKY